MTRFQTKEQQEKQARTSFLLRTNDLILLPHPNSIHPGMPTSAHHIPTLLILLDLLRSETDFSSSGDTLTFGDESGHGGSFSGSEVASETVGHNNSNKEGRKERRNESVG